MPELEMRDTEEWLIPCDCHSLHFFRLTWDNSAAGGYADIEYVKSNPGWGLSGLRYRISNAWDAFRSPNYTSASVALNREAINTLTEFVDSRWDWSKGELQK
jgi:hypothetical protein